MLGTAIRLKNNGNIYNSKLCMKCEVEGPRPRGRPMRTWREVVKDDCQARKLNKEDAMDRCKLTKLIKDVRWSGWVWVGEFLLVPAYPGSPGSKPLNGCVCVCYNSNLVIQYISPTQPPVLRPLYRSTSVSRHLQLRTGGFWWCKVLQPACPCWWQPAHSN